MEFTEISRRALEVRQRYAELEVARYGHAWTREDVAMGFVGDVGDLMKLVMAHQGRRRMPDLDRIGHELADCLWSVIVLASLYEVDLEAAFTRTMDEIGAHIDEALRESSGGAGASDE